MEKLKKRLYSLRYLMSINLKLSIFIKSALLLILFGKNPHDIILKNGIRLKGPNKHPLLEMVSEIHSQKIYTPNKNFEIGPEYTVIDIGANIGIFAVLAAKKTNKKVYAFEPFEKNQHYLKMNVAENKLSNVEVKEITVSDTVGPKNLFLMNNPAENILENRNYRNYNKDYITVKTTTLKQIIDSNRLKKVDFLKIDCEGAEGAILSSTPKKDLKKVKKVVIEFHDNISSLKHDDIVQLLRRNGFITKLVWDGASPFGIIYVSN
jgi:FkbM family methyltransferase